MSLLRIIPPPAHDEGHLLLTTAEDIAKTRAEGRTHVLLRDDEGRIVGIHVQTLGNSSKCMSYEARYGTGMITLRTLLFSEVKPYVGDYVKPRKPALWKERQKAKAARVVHIASDATDAACNRFFDSRPGVKIVFGEIVPT
jgi:hypothetical protein